MAALLAVGCSKGAADNGGVPVSGKVTYNAQPVEGATVTFLSDGAGAPGAALTAADGSYTLMAKPGNYRAMVSKTDVPASSPETSMEQAAADAAKPPQDPKEMLPAKYRSPTESPLKFEVKQSGENTFDLSLSD